MTECLVLRSAALQSHTSLLAITSHAVSFSCRVPFAGELSVGGVAPESPEQMSAVRR